MNLAMLLSCSSFEGFFGRVQGQSPKSYLETYRNDFAWYYARGLRDNGVNPIIYIPSMHETGKHETDIGVDVRFLRLNCVYLPLEFLWPKRLMRRSRWSLYMDEQLNALAFSKPLKASLIQDKIDVLYVQEYWSGRFDYIANNVDIPVVGADHGATSDRVVKSFKRTALKKAVQCYGQTERECRTIELYGGHSVLAPNGCDILEFFPDFSITRRKTILSVCRLNDRHKRTSDLIRVIATLPEEWSLDIVGAGPDRRMLEGLASGLRVSSRVRFHGFVGRAEVRDFLRRCGVFAMPSAHEAVALAALEAMACGAAVVLSRIPPFEDLITDGVNGRLAPVGEIAALATCIIDAWERREPLGSAAHNTVLTRYNSRLLYQRLAESLRAAAHRACYLGS